MNKILSLNFILLLLSSIVFAFEKAAIEEVLAYQDSGRYELNHLVTVPWLSADLNGDSSEELVVLVKDKKAKIFPGTEIYPTHMIIFKGQKSDPEFKKIKKKYVVKMNSGMPDQGSDSFLISQDTKFLKTIGCMQRAAVHMIEGAGTNFYLCWNGKKYDFFRDPNDTP